MKPWDKKVSFFEIKIPKSVLGSTSGAVPFFPKYKINHRMRIVLFLRGRGMTFREIGKKIKVSRSRAHQIYEKCVTAQRSEILVNLRHIAIALQIKNKC